MPVPKRLFYSHISCLVNKDHTPNANINSAIEQSLSSSKTALLDKYSIVSDRSIAKMPKTFCFFTSCPSYHYLILIASQKCRIPLGTFRRFEFLNIGSFILNNAVHLIKLVLQFLDRTLPPISDVLEILSVLFNKR